jgi:SpoIID/LytB domain protein
MFRRRFIVRAAVALVTTAAAVAPSAITARAGAGVAAVRIDGRGFGHGVGLSQDGELYMGRRGDSDLQILGQFFPGTYLARTSGTVRVLVLTGNASGVTVSFPQGGQIQDAAAGQQSAGFPLKVPAGARAVLSYSGGRYTAAVSGGPTSSASAAGSATPDRAGAVAAGGGSAGGQPRATGKAVVGSESAGGGTASGSLGTAPSSSVPSSSVPSSSVPSSSVPSSYVPSSGPTASSASPGGPNSLDGSGGASLLPTTTTTTLPDINLAPSTTTTTSPPASSGAGGGSGSGSGSGGSGSGGSGSGGSGSGGSGSGGSGSGGSGSGGGTSSSSGSGPGATASSSRPLWAAPDNSGVTSVSASGRRYRGEIEASADSGGSSIDLVNQLDVESYLMGMGEVQDPSWPLASLEAQAIVERTYALRAMQAAGEICDDTRCQVYLGQQAEYGAQDQAVRDTSGQVLGYGGQFVAAVFSANGGGYSATPEEGFGSSNAAYPYLRAAPYPTDNTDPWTITISLADVASRLGYAGTLTSLAVTSTGPSGRALSVGLQGSAGPATVSGLEVEADLGLRSNLFQMHDLISATAPPPPPAAQPGQALPTDASALSAAVASPAPPFVRGGTGPGRGSRGAAPAVGTAKKGATGSARLILRVVATALLAGVVAGLGAAGWRLGVLGPAAPGLGEEKHPFRRAGRPRLRSGEPS